LSERVAFPIPTFCYRNGISEPTYHRLRAKGRGPREMRIGLNLIRITAEAEREWQQQMQEDGTDLETRAAERAVKAGTAAVKSDRHISNVGAETPHHREKQTAPTGDVRRGHFCRRC